MSRERKGHPIQLVINDASTFLNTGVTIQFEIEDENKKMHLYGKCIGEELDGAPLGFPGYKFLIRGGSDIAGFPHIKGVPGPQLKEVLKSKPPGYRPRKYKIEKKTGGYKIINLKKVKRKKTVRGEELSERTRQVNLTIMERTGKNIEEMTEDEIMSDKILAEIAHKMGKIVMKWGLDAPQIVENGEKTPLRNKLEEAGLQADNIHLIYKKIGVKLLKLGNDRKKIIEPLKRVSRKNPHPLGKYIAQITYQLYKQIKNNEKDTSNPEQLSEEFANQIIEGTKKWLNNQLEKIKFNLNIKEE